MNGMNWKFKRNTDAFLREHPIIDAPRHAAAAPAQGIVEFDLEPVQGSTAVRLGDYANRGKAATCTTSWIQAYWLPWQSQGTSQIQLGGGADYFFTSQLAGCQIRILPSIPRYFGTNHPLVLHIAGNNQPPGDPTGTQWRHNQAVARVGGAGMFRSRALSSTGQGALGYRGEMVNVIGFIRRMQWQFWAQQVHIDDDDDTIITIARVWQL